MEDKYKSQYTGAELDNTVKYLDDSWIQLYITGGNPGESITAKSGEYVVIPNMMNSTTVGRHNCTFSQISKTYPITQDIQYEYYQSMQIDSMYTSNNNATIATMISAVYMKFPAEKNHIYYFRCYADGVLCNGVQFGVNIQEKDSSYVPTKIYGEWTMNPRTNSTYKDEQMFSIRCKINDPSNSNYTPGDVEVAFYANKNDSTQKRSIVRYGWPVIVDLTAGFGAGNEPSQSWCDRNLWTLSSDRKTYRNVLFPINYGQYEDVTGIFDDDGNCILSLPGFGLWNVFLLDDTSTFSVQYFNKIVVNEVKRYYMDITSSNLTYRQYKEYQGTTEVLQEVFAKYGTIGERITTFDLFRLEDNNQVMINTNIIDPGKTDITYYIYEKLPGDNGSFNYLDYRNETPVRTGAAEYYTYSGQHSEYGSTHYERLYNLQNYVFFINITGDYTQNNVRIYWQISDAEDIPDAPQTNWGHYRAEYGELGAKSSTVYIFEVVNDELVAVNQPITELLPGSTGLNYKIYKAKDVPTSYDYYKNDTPVRNVAMTYESGNVYKATYSKLSSGQYKMFAILQPES